MSENEYSLHRIVWSPDDFDDGELTTSAFPKDDLKANSSRYLSVSRTDLLDPESERAIVKGQFSKSHKTRDEAYSLLLKYKEVIQAVDDKGSKPFSVEDLPTDENPAHCALRNKTDCSGKAYVNQLRLILLKLSSSLNKFEENLRILKKNNKKF